MRAADITSQFKICARFNVESIVNRCAMEQVCDAVIIMWSCVEQWRLGLPDVVEIVELFHCTSFNNWYLLIVPLKIINQRYLSYTIFCGWADVRLCSKTSEWAHCNYIPFFRWTTVWQDLWNRGVRPQNL